MRWEINANVLIRVTNSEEESSEQRAKNKSFPHHWDKTQLNMHAENGNLEHQHRLLEKKITANLDTGSRTCLLLFLCNKSERGGQMLGTGGLVHQWLSAWLPRAHVLTLRGAWKHTHTHVLQAVNS